MMTAGVFAIPAGVVAAIPANMLKQESFSQMNLIHNPPLFSRDLY